MRNPHFDGGTPSMISQLNKSPSGSNDKISVSDMTKKAVQDALSGWDPSDGSLYYSKFDTDNLKLTPIKNFINRAV